MFLGRDASSGGKASLGRVLGKSGAGLREQHAKEEEEIAAWVSGQPDVEAQRTSSFAPEQWEGSVDGHSFYFRERGGWWRIELDLEPTGNFAQRLAEVREDGELVTEPVPIMEGRVIAEGVESQLGESALDHISFIVRTIRDHLWAEQCDHLGAVSFVPSAGNAWRPRSKLELRSAQPRSPSTRLSFMRPANAWPFPVVCWCARL